MRPAARTCCRLPAATDPSTAFRRNRPAPHGQIFLNVDFADNTVNGNVSDRTLVDTEPPCRRSYWSKATSRQMARFWAMSNMTATQRRSIGAFGGVFGGTDAAAVGGVISLDQFFDDAGIANNAERERGVFVLIQCGQPGDDPACP